MTRFLERLLRLERGDLRRGLPLFAYLFLILASYMVARIARDALFLDKYDPDKLPFVDIAIAVLVGFAVAAYIRFGRGASLRNLLLGCLAFFAANCLLFWWLSHSFQLAWLYPVIYIWVGIFGVLAVSQVWTLANYVLTTRDAKRIFGLIGSGAISGAIFGGKFANIVAPRWGTEALFLAIMVALLICLFLVAVIWKQRYHHRAPSRNKREAASEAKTQNLAQSLRLVRGSAYLQAIAGLILVASVVTSIAGWQFKAIAKYHYMQKDLLAAFFGDFYFYAGIAGLLIQLLFTARFLRRFGLGPALFIVPVALLLGSVGLLIWGGLYAVIALRGSINLFQYSVDKSTVELLYLPIPADIKVQVKSFIDTVVWRMGDGLSGAILLLFVTSLGLSAVQVSWITLVLIGGWATAAWAARGQYVAALRTSVRQHRLDAERAAAPFLDRSTTQIIVENLRRADTKHILYALSLFQVSGKKATHPAIRELLTHPAAEVRKKCIGLLSAAGDRSVLPKVEELLGDPDFEVRTEALLYLTHHAHIDPLKRIQEMADYPDFSIRSSMVAFLARPGDTQNLEAARMILGSIIDEQGAQRQEARLEAARLLGTLPDAFDEELRRLLGDNDLKVAAEAIRTVGSLRKRRLVPAVLDRLTEPKLERPVVEALSAFGDRIAGTLRDCFGDHSTPIAARRAIPEILVQIGTPAAERVLAENLLESETALRFQIIAALNKLHQSHPEFELDRQMIEMVLAAEIMGHYRSYQILGTLGDQLKESDSVSDALRDSMQQEVERIFRLLALLFPQYDLHSAYFGLQSRNVEVHDNALELLDNILKPELRGLLVPLLDSHVSTRERVGLANRLVGAPMENCEEAVAALMCSEDAWLKSCGAYAIGKLGLRNLEKELDGCLDHPDPLLRETARQAKLRLAEAPTT